MRRKICRYIDLPLQSIFFVDPPFTELGCFDEDNAADFKLTFDLIRDSRTPETCIYYCYNAGYRYAGNGQFHGTLLSA